MKTFDHIDKKARAFIEGYTAHRIAAKRLLKRRKFSSSLSAVVSA